MRRASAAVFVSLLIVGGITILALWPYMRSLLPALAPPTGDIVRTIETGGAPLTLPVGFSIEILAKNLPGARVMRFDSFGGLWVSQPSEGTVSMIEFDRNTGKPARTSQIFNNLKKPHGLLFGVGEQFAALYIAEEDKIVRVATYSDQVTPELIATLPAGGNHTTRTIDWLPGFENQKMLVSIGSTCNVCHEENAQRASIQILDMKTKKLTPYATGLRNSVFTAMHPVDGSVWATEMGRDMLGDNLPPDEVNVIQEGKFYGWPICYGKNVHDDEFDKNVYIRNPCMTPFETPSTIDIPAHSAPLGLAFIPEEGWPEAWWYDLLVAYHGSWNRTEPTGYKIVRFPLNAKGQSEGQPQDFITGWLTPSGALGRPVDIIAQPGGTIYISDDKAGVIYKVTRTTQP